jgi:hypothetical protein
MAHPAHPGTTGLHSGAGTGGAGGATGPPIFGRSVNPIQTGGGQIIPTYYYWPPQFFSPSGITAAVERSLRMTSN